MTGARHDGTGACSCTIPRSGRRNNLDEGCPVLQGYLAHTKTPPPLGPPWGPRHRPTVGSWGLRAPRRPPARRHVFFFRSFRFLVSPK